MDEKTPVSSAVGGKSLMHFSDGVMEVNGDDNVKVDAPVVETTNPKTLDWAPWTFHMTKKAGVRALEVCDYLGESLASFFGITTPKYQFEINEYHKMIQQAEEEQKERDVEMGNWGENKTATDTVLKPPQSVSDLPRF